MELLETRKNNNIKPDADLSKDIRLWVRKDIKLKFEESRFLTTSDFDPLFKKFRVDKNDNIVSLYNTIILDKNNLHEKSGNEWLDFLEEEIVQEYNAKINDLKKLVN